jgi:hypothetical protein
MLLRIVPLFLLFASCTLSQTPVATSAKPGQSLTASDIREIKRLVHSASREPLRGDPWNEYSREETIEVHTACPTCIWGDAIFVKLVSGKWHIVQKSTWNE